MLTLIICCAKRIAIYMWLSVSDTDVLFTLTLSKIMQTVMQLNNVQTRKTLGERRSPSSILLTKISKWSKIQDSFRIIPKNWTTCSFCHSRHFLKISERFSRNFLSYLANTQTNKLWQKHNLLGGGNYLLIFTALLSQYLRTLRTLTNRVLTRSSKRPALTSVFWIHLLEVC